MRESITIIGAIFLTFTFLAILLTYTLANPIDSILEAILNMEHADSAAQRALYIPLYRSAIVIVFAISVAIPFGWFIAKIFSREPDVNPYEYQQQGRFRP